jgi:hypothetical protein
MGRYSLNQPGRVYAHSGNIGFDASKYSSFPADEDGIIPVMDLHRYNEATLSRMRGSYVNPLQGKLNARIEYLRNEVDRAGTSSARKKLTQELELLRKKQTELARFDEELRHLADQKITLDLDDGVKVNYGKFGNLLAEKKAVTGEPGA